MGRRKKVVDGVETEEEVETPDEVVTQPEVVVEESDAKKKFRELLEVYKRYNPGKYALKEQALLAKLNSL